MFLVNQKGTFHIDFSQVFYMYFELCFALCCALELKEMFVNITEAQVIFSQDIICFSTDFIIFFYFFLLCAFVS